MAKGSRTEELGVMSFGDHLEELRTRIIRSLLVALGGVIIALFVQEHLLRIMTRPHLEAMKTISARSAAWRLVRDLDLLRESLAVVPAADGAAAYRRFQVMEQGLAQFRRERDQLPDPIRADLAGVLDAWESWATLISELSVRGDLFHSLDDLSTKLLDECQGRLDEAPRRARPYLAESGETVTEIRSILEGWRKTELTAPRAPDWRPLERGVVALESARERVGQIIELRTELKPLNALAYQDKFFAYLKVCFLAGIVIVLPWLTFEMWGFVAKGLYVHERRSVYPFLPFSFLFLALGGMFAYFVLIPVGLGYLGGYGSEEVVEAAFTLKDYLSLVFILILGMALVFQVPILMVFLAKAGIAQPKDFRRYRKISIIGAVTIGALLTPPDVVTQLLMAGPLILLYETGILASVLLTRKRPKGAPNGETAA